MGLFFAAYFYPLKAGLSIHFVVALGMRIHPEPFATLPFWKKIKILIAGILDDKKTLNGMDLNLGHKTIQCNDCGKSATLNIL